MALKFDGPVVWIKKGQQNRPIFEGDEENMSYAGGLSENRAVRLKFINFTRAKWGGRPLNPEAAKWDAEDIRCESVRLLREFPQYHDRAKEIGVPQEDFAVVGASVRFDLDEEEEEEEDDCSCWICKARKEDDKDNKDDSSAALSSLFGAKIVVGDSQGLRGVDLERDCELSHRSVSADLSLPPGQKAREGKDEEGDKNKKACSCFACCCDRAADAEEH